MAYVITDEQNFTDIAGAIRLKLNVETTYLPSEMAAAIGTISGGGSTLGTKSITQNGTYNATDDSLDGYSSVTVNVAGEDGVYKGTTAPTADIGENGDIYLQVAELPSDISYVEYIESNGDCYFDTGIVGEGDMTAYCKFNYTNSSAAWMFGARESGGQNQFAVIYYSAYSCFRLDYGNNEGVNVSSSASTLNTTHEVELGAKCIFDGSTIATSSDTSFTTPDSMILFAMHQHGTTVEDDFTGIKIYRFTIKQDGAIVADFVPCLDANSVPCFYEAISGTYVYNASTGTPLYGSTDTPTESFAMYLKQDGSWVSKGVYPQFV